MLLATQFFQSSSYIEKSIQDRYLLNSWMFSRKVDFFIVDNRVTSSIFSDLGILSKLFVMDLEIDVFYY